jgi:hypothetical protein
MVFLVILVLLLTVFGINFLISAGVMWLICLCFGLTFSWRIVLGIWLVLVLLSWFFKSVNNNKN